MRTALALVALLIPSVAFAAPQSFRELVGLVVLIINVATPMLVALALALFIFRGVMVMKGKGDGKTSFAAEFRRLAIWSIAIIFVMVSIWGILAILEETFLSSSGGGGGNYTTQGSPGCSSLDGSGC